MQNWNALLVKAIGLRVARLSAGRCGGLQPNEHWWLG
jgi:hypothetical protein